MSDDLQPQAIDPDAIERHEAPQVGEPDASDVSTAAVPGEGGLSVRELDAIAVELADVEAALARLGSGDYWIDEISGRALSEDYMAANPTARSQAPA